MSQMFLPFFLSLFYQALQKRQLHLFFQKIYPKGPENGRTVQMNCESVGSDFQAIWQKILKRQVYANFGQSSVTKTLPSPLKARIGKSGNE